MQIYGARVYVNTLVDSANFRYLLSLVDGYTPIHNAAKRGHVQLVIYLLRVHISIAIEIELWSKNLI